MNGKMFLSGGTLVVCLAILFAVPILVFSSSAIADDGYKHGHHKTKEYSPAIHMGDSEDDEEGNDNGNEVTGIISAVLLAIANIPVFVSFVTGLLTAFLSLSDGIRKEIKKINSTQKKYLMPLHYYLNLCAIIPVLMHFRLSTCRASMLPEAAMLIMLCIMIFGAAIKFRILTGIIRKYLYQVHTSSLTTGIFVIILIIGHSMVD